MRDIEFRDVRKDKKTGAISFYHFSLEELRDTDSWEGSLPYIVIATNQFTGLCDKNGAGKKVYDGDRFKDGGVVMWIKAGWFVHFKSYDVPLNEYLYNDPSRETVGTIHDMEAEK